MSNTLADIPIATEEPVTGMVAALLVELANFLDALAQHQTPHSIDLHSLPMNDADRAALKTALGQGEVSITLQSMGESRIYETAYAGIWWLSHFDVEGRLLSELIEICRVPAILVPHQEDIARAAATLGTVATRRSAHD